MGKTLEGIDWIAIKREYQEGVKIVDLSKKYGVRSGTIYQKKDRGEWDSNKELVKEIVRKSVERSVDEIIPKVDEAKAWVQDTILRGKTQRKRLDRTYADFQDTISPDDLVSCQKVESAVDSDVRRSFGLDKIDPAQQTVHLNLNSSFLQALQESNASLQELSLAPQDLTGTQQKLLDKYGIAPKNPDGTIIEGYSVESGEEQDLPEPDLGSGI